MMKTITIDQMIQITTEMFNDYVEPVALSLMCGEVPNTTFIIHRIGSDGNDLFPRVRFKNTVNISVFKCDIWLDDILLLCRKCKMYLVTEQYSESYLFSQCCIHYIRHSIWIFGQT